MRLAGGTFLSGPITLKNLTATGAKQTAIIAGLPESPIYSLFFGNVHLQGEKGMHISNATVTAHGLSVLPATPPAVILLDNGKLNTKQGHRGAG